MCCKEVRAPLWNYDVPHNGHDYPSSTDPRNPAIWRVYGGDVSHTQRTTRLQCTLAEDHILVEAGFTYTEVSDQAEAAFAEAAESLKVEEPLWRVVLRLKDDVLSRRYVLGIRSYWCWYRCLVEVWELWWKWKDVQFLLFGMAGEAQCWWCTLVVLAKK
jgi:hypothetical protein